MLKKILLIIINMTFSFYSLMAIDDDSKTMPTSQPFIRKTMIYTFNEEGKMIGKEKEDDPIQSDKIFLESESLLKEESQTQPKLDNFGNMLVTSLCCPCLMPCVVIYGCMIFYRDGC